MLNGCLGRVDDEVLLLSRTMKDRLAVLLEGWHLVAEGLRQLRIDLKHELPDGAEDTLNLHRCFSGISLCQVFQISSF